MKMNGSNLNPNAAAFIPSAVLQEQPPQPPQQQSLAMSGKRTVKLNPDAETSVFTVLPPSSPTQYPAASAWRVSKKTSQIQAEICKAYDLLKHAQPQAAGKIFRNLLDHEQYGPTAKVGFARSLLKQDEKQHCREAEKILTDLKNKSKSRKVGDEVLSEITDLDMSLARALEASGKWVPAKKLLQTMARDHKRDLDPDDWSSPCGNHTIDITRVRLLQVMGDYNTAGKLLQAMARNHKRDLEPDDGSSPCGNHTIDIARVRLQEERGDCKPAGKLLQAMARNHKRDLDPDDWSSPCGNHTIDLARVRLQEERGDCKPAGKLLQAMAWNHKRDLEPNDWSSPCDNHTIDITRVRLLQVMGDYNTAGKLLQAMAWDHKSDLAPDDWSSPCGNHTIDITRVRLLQVRGDYNTAGDLLQAMAWDHKSDLDPDDWSSPCGNHTIDLARVRLLQERKDYDTVDALAKACISIYPARPEYTEVYLICLGEQKKWRAFDDKIDSMKSTDKNSLIHSKNIQLALSIRYFQEAICRYEERKNHEGLLLCMTALAIAESVRERYPSFAPALSQSAHCFRLLGIEKSGWKELFRRANVIDTERMKREKRDHWREQEQRVLEALGRTRKA